MKTTTVLRNGRAYRVTCNGTDHQTIDTQGHRLWCLPMECAACGLGQENT